MSIKLVIYSVKKIYGVPTLSMDLTNIIKEIKYNEYVMIELPIIGLKKCNWYAYIQASYIFDDGNIFMFICDYKKVDRKYALRYLLQYEEKGRINAKDYSLKKPIRVKYENKNRS